MQKPIILNPPTTTSGVNGGFSMQQLNDMVLSVVTWRKGTARPDDIQDGEKWHKVDADGNTIGFFEWRTQDGAGDGKNILEYWASVTAAAGKVPLAQLDPDTGEVVFDDSWKMGGGGGMPIGASIAVYCTPTYTPFGAVPQNGASYSETQFPNIAQYIEDGFIPWKTPTEYDAEVAAHGKCGFFAWDAAARTFRVPLMPDGTFVQQAMSDSALGKSYDAGLPNITGEFIGSRYYSQFGQTKGSPVPTHQSTFTGAIKEGSYTGERYFDGFETSGMSNGFILDASGSNPIYGNSDTVQPSAIALRHFVVVATETDQQSVMDWSAWASSLAGKANRTDLALLMSPPDYSRGSTTVIPDNTEYEFIPEENGYLVVDIAGFQNSYSWIKVNGVEWCRTTSNASGYVLPLAGMFIVRAGDTINIRNGYNPNSFATKGQVIFYPCKKVV